MRPGHDDGEKYFAGREGVYLLLIIASYNIRPIAAPVMVNTMLDPVIKSATERGLLCVAGLRALMSKTFLYFAVPRKPNQYGSDTP